MKNFLPDNVVEIKVGITVKELEHDQGNFRQFVSFLLSVASDEKESLFKLSRK